LSENQRGDPHEVVPSERLCSPEREFGLSQRSPRAEERTESANDPDPSNRPGSGSSEWQRPVEPDQKPNVVQPKASEKSRSKDRSPSGKKRTRSRSPRKDRGRKSSKKGKRSKSPYRSYRRKSRSRSARRKSRSRSARKKSRSRSARRKSRSRSARRKSRSRSARRKSRSRSARRKSRSGSRSARRKSRSGSRSARRKSRSGSRSKCKMIADSTGELPVALPHVSDEEDDGKLFGGAAIREQKVINFNIS
ncbi:PREDICTED: serine/arginine repetitive matrix protein 2-like, partial [Cyprinodon variegatus]|uniref:serine/arginine repetitive matrix protein 2-like n=1 Tax=Cyprinodon variegatus TaxID=28743 RepID=UPI000742C8D5